MNKQWTDDIRKRMERRQTAAPEGLLDDVKREMALRGLAPKPAASRRRAATARLWLYRTAAAAAVVLAVFLLWPGSDEERAVKPLAFVPTKEVAQAATRLQATRLHQPETADRVELAEAAELVATAAIGQPSLQNQPDPADAPDQPASSERSDNSEQPGKSARPKPSAHDDLPFILPSPSSSTDSRLSIATSYGGAMGSTSGATGMTLATADPIGNYEREFDGKKSEGLMQEVAMEKHTKHKQPVRVGVSVGYRLNRRWSLQTGLNYSYLSSTTTYSGGAEGNRTEQSLHYVGLPLSAAYTLAQGRHYRVYATAGMQVEKLVSGKLSAAGKGTADTELPTRNIKEKQLQFSANAAVGAELRLRNSVSAYVEPGVSRYFNNRSEVENIYKDKPTNFNLNVGLRIYLNNF